MASSRVAGSRINYCEETLLSGHSFYLMLGEEAGVRALVDRFYELMDAQPDVATIRAMHPADLSRSRDRLSKFLCGFFGGPALYQEEFGPPMLRARHLPFAIGAAERDQWLQCMEQALDEQLDDKFVRDQMKTSFRRTAHHMINQVGTEADVGNWPAPAQDQSDS